MVELLLVHHRCCLVREILSNASDGTCKLLVGNKTDMSEHAVDYDNAKAFADDLAVPLIQTSGMCRCRCRCRCSDCYCCTAKDATNVEQAFLTMATELITIREMTGGPDAATVDPAAAPKSRGGKCC